jgi:hypothetical protein
MDTWKRAVGKFIHNYVQSESSPRGNKKKIPRQKKKK